ncbi:unnamed protein product [Lepidochelys kempii]
MSPPLPSKHPLLGKHPLPQQGPLPPMLMPSPTAALHGGSAPRVRSAPQRPRVPGCMPLDSAVILSFVRLAALCPGARGQKNKDSPLLLISGSGCTPHPQRSAQQQAAELSQSDEIPSPQRAGSEGWSDPTDPERGQSAGQQLPSSRDFGKCQQTLRHCSLAPAPAAGPRVNTCSVSQINGEDESEPDNGGEGGERPGALPGEKGADGAPTGFSSAGGTGAAAGKRSRISKVEQWECALHPSPGRGPSPLQPSPPELVGPCSGLGFPDVAATQAGILPLTGTRASGFSARDRADAESLECPLLAGIFLWRRQEGQRSGRAVAHAARHPRRHPNPRVSPTPAAKLAQRLGNASPPSSAD